MSSVRDCEIYFTFVWIIFPPLCFLSDHLAEILGSTAEIYIGSTVELLTNGIPSPGNILVDHIGCHA